MVYIEGMGKLVSCFMVALGCGVLAPAFGQSIEIVAPTERSVYQRLEFKRTIEVPVRVTASGLASGDRVEVRAMTAGRQGPWLPLQPQPDVPVLAGTVELPQGGWHRLEVRVQRGGRTLVVEEISEVGVGEVIMCLGSTLAANLVGVEEVVEAEDGGPGAQPDEEEEVEPLPMVSMWDGNRWQSARDPVAGADGSGESLWTGLAEGLADRLGMPVGIVCVASSRSRIDDWQVNGQLYGRVRQFLTGPGQLYGVRAVLWVHGEQDSLAGTPTLDYQDILSNLIETSQEDYGEELQWGVAFASHHPQADLHANQQVLQALRQTVRRQPPAFAGPDTTRYPVTEGYYTEEARLGPVGIERLRSDWTSVLSRYFLW